MNKSIPAVPLTISNTVFLLAVFLFCKKYNKCFLLTCALEKTYTLLHLLMEYTAQDSNLRVTFRYDIGIQLQPYVSLVAEA